MMDGRGQGGHGPAPRVQWRGPGAEAVDAPHGEDATERGRGDGDGKVVEAVAALDAPAPKNQRRRPRSKAEANRARLVRHLQARDARLTTQHEPQPTGGEVHEEREEA